MPEHSENTLRIQGLIDRLQAGDETAREQLIQVACDRLVRLTRKMLHEYPRVHRWEQTDDVFQNATMRLYRSLEEVTPRGVGDFFRLAALNIRRELLDLAKHHYGARGIGANHATLPPRNRSESHDKDPLEQSGQSDELDRMSVWTEFHQQADNLPEEEREVFDLLWYQGLTQSEAAAILKVNERTIKRRWQSARLKLHDALKGEMPED